MKRKYSEVKTILIGGQAGMGILLSGRVLAKFFGRMGLYTFLHTEYPSLIRGGHNFCILTVGNRKVYSQRLYADTLIALDKTTLEKHLWRLKHNCLLIIDKKIEGDLVKRDKFKIVELPLDELLARKKLPLITKNMVMLGSLVAILGYGIDTMIDVVSSVFKTKYKTENIEATKLGYEYTLKNFKHLQETFIDRGVEKKIIITSGNEAIAIGAVLGGMKIYTAYPITPASPLLHLLAAHQRELDIVVVQAEDEIAAINIAIGAWYAGARAITATSGPGFSLMCESIGLAGLTETPLVVILAQRQGPSTGLPTYTSQSDLKLALQASHGEFPKIVIAPGDIEESLVLTSTALDLAERYQVPVIVLVDRYIVESYKAIDFPNITPLFERHYVVEERDVIFKRYAITESGISPFAIPGMGNALVKVNSLEHDEYGFFVEEEKAVESMIEKRLRKMSTIYRDLGESDIAAKTYGNGREVIVSWGSTKGPILEAMNILESKGLKMKYLQVILLAPFPKDKIRRLLRGCERVLVVENNATGQFANLLKEYLDAEIISLLKYNGRPFYPEEIVERVEEVVRK